MTKNNWLVADICDQSPNNFDVLPQIFHSYGKIKKCQGKIETVLLDEDNGKLIELLGQDGSERIVVVQCHRKDSAVFGDQLAKLAIDHHWGGVIVDGAIRDIATLREMPICVFASATYPVRGKQNGGGEIGVIIKIGDTLIKPNDYIYADEDGIIISTKYFEGF
jgi:regulator of ribonuclease activity A